MRKPKRQRTKDVPLNVRSKDLEMHLRQENNMRSVFSRCRSSFWRGQRHMARARARTTEFFLTHGARSTIVTVPRLILHTVNLTFSRTRLFSHWRARLWHLFRGDNKIQRLLDFVDATTISCNLSRAVSRETFFFFIEMKNKKETHGTSVIQRFLKRLHFLNRRRFTWISRAHT